MSIQHSLEPTGVSTTNTVVDRDSSDARPALGSAFSGKTLTISAPDPVDVHGVRHTHTREDTLDPRLAPSIIPPEHPHRTLVLCFDGTGDQFDADNSNIVQLVSLLKKNDRQKQMVYYQAGIGTYTSPKVVTPFMSSVSKTLDQMFAWNLDAHVMGGYEFLMQNYVEGDRICIFGFSRGAYTARSLAGMIHKVGLLPADNFQQVPFAYKMYTRADDIGWEQSNAFKAAFSIDVDIEFLGVWDTVSSVGLIPKRLPFTTSNTIVRTFRHAVALDERRAKFKANLWNRPSPEEEQLGLPTMTDKPVGGSPIPFIRGLKKDKSQKRESSGSSEEKEERELSNFERIYSEKNNSTTDIEEVWFSGCHCDVGGGSVSNKTRNSLARIPLRWMVRECFRKNSGIMFHAHRLRDIGLDPTTLYPFVTPRPPPLPVGSLTVEKISLPSRIKRMFSHFRGHPPPDISSSTSTSSTEKKSDIDAVIRTEEEEDLYDSMSPIYDQLCLQRIWWLLEIIPLNLRYQKGDNQWVDSVTINMAAPRFIPKQKDRGFKVHRTVKQRMDAAYPASRKKKYMPKPEFKVDPTWVD
ncbi:hypothetical protein BDZ94DRAFT_1257527 [Collybia nuda]|uniref:T6SS Phospholipase effector Tle1-like catalytic domain-containing protein n=1 Tax=Collybia nuda TaxID=64659 RepID=A0A9P5Y884_9AGAR|nr:hypothetical protein BDZ94DRAFT_1257527 [Collybia nuda]